MCKNEIYSSGMHGTVYNVSSKEKGWFPEAELVREEYYEDRYWFARLYYRQKIAHLLFPDNFIEVVGAQVDPPEPELYRELRLENTVWGNRITERVHKIYSKKAPVDPDHAIFSAHMELYVDSRYLIDSVVKGSRCKCPVCSKHRQMHVKENLGGKAEEILDHMDETGIWVDRLDQSDYCITPEGKLIFFEVEEFDRSKMRKYLQRIAHPSSTERLALRYLNRHDALLEMSKQDWRTGECQSLPHN